MGNRGILHNDHQTLGPARWRHKAWVCCLTEFKNRKRRLMAPRHYTELFFHDEAVALAAGHRPCGECRRVDYRAYLDAAGHTGPIKTFDAHLHTARAIPRVFAQNRLHADIKDLPDGTFILAETGPALLWQDAMHPFLPQGYQAPAKRPKGIVTVLTPQPTLSALLGGYRPLVTEDVCTA